MSTISGTGVAKESGVLLLSRGKPLRFSLTAHRPQPAILSGNLLPFLALVLLLQQSAQAASRTWGNTATDFNTGASWQAGTAPGSGDTALFSSARVTQPNLSSSLSFVALRFSAT